MYSGFTHLEWRIKEKQVIEYPVVIKDGWNIPELNGGFKLGKALIFMVHVPASHV